MNTESVSPDGIYFVPKNEYQYELSMFNYVTEDLDHGKTENEYHIAFFYDDEHGNPIFEEKFDAIFFHPETYLKNLIGSKYYGVMARKSTKSAEWFDFIIDELIRKMGAKHE